MFLWQTRGFIFTAGINLFLYIHLCVYYHLSNRIQYKYRAIYAEKRLNMKFRMVHENYNVANLEKSMAFYEKALGLREAVRKKGNGFTIV